MRWRYSYKADPRASYLADRHYNRRAIGAKQFCPPSRTAVFLSVCERAVWVTSWQKAEYVRHAWAGAWVNSLFRNEGAGLSSELILEAIAATLVVWPEPPDLGIVTFVDAGQVRRKRDPGRCYRRAGFEHVGFTKGGLYAFQLTPDRFPLAEEAWPYRYVLPWSFFVKGINDVDFTACSYKAQDQTV
jgi:hypothetical protein